MGTISRITTDMLYDKIHAAAERAAPLFNLYGWTYREGKVPTLNELVDTITRLTDSAIEHFYKSEEEFRSSEVGSGRFSVKVHEFEEEVEVKIVLELGEHSWYKAQKTS